MIALDNINRVEVIDQTGRAYVHYLNKNEKVQYSLQDDNKTLKIFINTIEGKPIMAPEKFIAKYNDILQPVLKRLSDK